MSAIGQLAAGIAHEINNPIGFVNSNLGSLRNYVSDIMRLIEVYQTLADACPPGDPAVVRVNEVRKDTDIRTRASKT